uniref:SET domain-containing protein n=1 Tax=Panagrolaimus sp. ES5 TaxID=591445 RepID=A0AC34G354_9BILA
MKTVVEYTGNIINHGKKRQLLNEYKHQGIECLYMMGSSVGITDATQNGNIAKFINHSCDPNCSIQEFSTYGSRVFIVARRKIQQYEEITIDYRLSFCGTLTECHCESKSCRGYLENPGSKLVKEMLKKKKADELRIAEQDIMVFEKLGFTTPIIDETHTSAMTFEGSFSEDIALSNNAIDYDQLNELNAGFEEQTETPGTRRSITPLPPCSTCGKTGFDTYRWHEKKRYCNKHFFQIPSFFPFFLNFMSCLNVVIARFAESTKPTPSER